MAGVVDVGYGRAAGSGWGQRSLEWLGLRLELEGDGGEDGESVVRAEGDSDVGGAIGHGLLGLGSRGVFAFPMEAELIGNGSAVEVNESFDFHSSHRS